MIALLKKHGKTKHLANRILIIFDDLALNKNLFLSAIRISAKQIEPITGLFRIGQRSGSFIYASPKQRLKMVPVHKGNLPHALMTTGAITQPNYKTTRFMSERTAYISTHDHVMGAVIVEIEDDIHFHFRQIQADSKGHFIDLNKHYRGGKVETIQPETFVIGDWHSGDTDPDVKKAWFDVIKALKPKKIIIHDVFNGKSINPHDRHKCVTRAIQAHEKKLNLQEEFDVVAEDCE